MRSTRSMVSFVQCERDTAMRGCRRSEAGGSTRSLPDGEPLRYNKEDLHNPWFVCESKFCKL